ncbi:hypothetical protein [Hymenobacter metallicola]|uniref:Uncharacterized protein n=1 Tax=Hymenobacter metallicola TaxID=2563114 RepID=A0A4Z0PVY5_9BACT|nr:hypothetical protein [Hymenobacter metallicola]TGE21023.1 hypothetical protein E5K02_24995 [Hymenobacter metallicola]
MWRVLFCLWALFRVAPLAAQSAPQRVTWLQLQNSYFLGFYQYTVTADSLMVQWLNLNPCPDSVYRRALTPRERNQLLAAVNHTYLSTIRAEYQCATTNSDEARYTVIIQKGTRRKRTEISGCQVPWFNALVQELNRLLPETHRCGYLRL